MILYFNVDGKSFGGRVVRRECQSAGLVTVEVIGEWPLAGTPPKGPHMITLSKKFVVKDECDGSSNAANN